MQFSQHLAKFEAALENLQIALAHQTAEDGIVIDATIRGFVFVFELGWRALQNRLFFQGHVCQSPRDTFREAFHLGWLSEGDVLWNQIMEDRNLTTHAYDQEIALKVYSRIREYQKPFQRLADFLSKK